MYIPANGVLIRIVISVTLTGADRSLDDTELSGGYVRGGSYNANVLRHDISAQTG